MARQHLPGKRLPNTPRKYAHTLNREHVAYPAIKELTSLRETFISRLTAREHATLWSGNACEILQFGARELKDFVGRGERLVADLRKDAISLAGATPRQSLTRKAG